MSKAKAETAVYAGIDVSKAWLDIYLHPFGHALCVPNSKEGLHGPGRVRIAPDFGPECVENAYLTTQ